MVRELLYKLFGLEPPSCKTCEVLRAQLESCNYERRELLTKLLDKDIKKEEPIADTHDLQPILPQYTPWKVRQQILEKEDRAKARLLKEKELEVSQSHPEIADLEKELGVEDVK
jgi:hypothetical protein